jgi:APA family basic amino acid/polyamine antiporter
MEPVRQDATRTAHFGLWDSICIIVGIIIGVGIFKTPGSVFSLSGGPGQALAIWVIGGVLSMIGALCFAELAATYPHSGGEYVYLTRAFGPCAGFLYAWGQLLFIRTGASIVTLAYVFADYTVRLTRMDVDSPEMPAVYILLTLLPILGLTAINIIGVRTGKWTQNTLTVVKVLGLAGVLVAGFVWARSRAPAEEYIVYEGRVLATGSEPASLLLETPQSPAGRPFALAPGAKITVDGDDKNNSGESYTLASVLNKQARVVALAKDPTRALRVTATTTSLFAALSLAFIFVMYAYTGWNEVAYIATEVRDRRRTLPLALVLGTAVMIVLYVLVNIAYLVGLGYVDAANSSVVAADVLALVPWHFAEPAICLLVIISALGSINGTIFTSSRIFAAFGKDHSMFAPLGRWHATLGTPVVSLLIQCGVCLITVAVVAVCFPNHDSFEALLAGTAGIFWVYYLATGIALFALRRRDRGLQRPFTVPGYPFTPLVFCALCGWLLWGSVLAKPRETVACFGIVLVGIPLFLLSKHSPGPAQETIDQHDSQSIRL